MSTWALWLASSFPIRAEGVVTVPPALDRTGDFAAFLGEDENKPAIDALRLARSTGRPVGAVD